MSALWYVNVTADQEKANMVWSKYIVQTVMGLDYVGSPPVTPTVASTRMTKKAKKEDIIGIDEVTEVYVHKPVLVNSKPLQKDEELLMYKAKEKKREREVEAIKVSKLAKLATNAASSHKGSASSSKD